MMKNFNTFWTEMAAAQQTGIGKDYSTLKKQIVTMVNSLTEVMNKYEERLVQLHRILGQKGMAISGAMAGQAAKIEKLEAEIKEMVAQTAELKQAHEKEIQNAKEEIGKLSSKVRELETGSGQIAKHLESANSDIEQSRLKVQDLTGKLEEMERKWKQEVQNANAEHQAAFKSGQALDAEKAAHAVTKGELEGERAQRSDLEASFQQYSRALEQANEELKGEIQNLRDLVEGLRADLEKVGGAATYDPSKRKGVQMGLDDFKPMASPKLDTAHTRPYGGFDLKEHLDRARKKQGITETWF